MSDSYVVMDSKKLRKLCEGVIRRIDGYRADMRKDYLQKISNRWYHELGLWPRPSEEELERINYWLIEAGDSVNTSVPSFAFAYWREKSLAKELLKACDYSDTVHVSVSDLDRLL